MDTDHQLCAICGHYQFLHMSNFKTECDACDSPDIPMEERCPGFQPPSDGGADVPKLA
jgi:hypothetical protein